MRSCESPQLIYYWRATSQFVSTVTSKCGKPDQTKEIIIDLLESRMWFFRWLRKHNPNKPFSCWCEVVNPHNWYFNNKQRNSLSVLWHPNMKNQTKLVKLSLHFEKKTRNTKKYNTHIWLLKELLMTHRWWTTKEFLTRRLTILTRSTWEIVGIGTQTSSTSGDDLSSLSLWLPTNLMFRGRGSQTAIDHLRGWHTKMNSNIIPLDKQLLSMQCSKLQSSDLAVSSLFNAIKWINSIAVRSIVIDARTCFHLSY